MKWVYLIRSSIEGRSKLLVTYLSLMGVGLLLIIFRQFIPTDKPLLFLLWNVFLAMIPLAISTVLLKAQSENHPMYVQLLLGLAWLVFFPNAPYMLTDYIHLTYGDQTYFWLDLITLSYFAFIALVTAVISLKDIEHWMMVRYNKAFARLLIFGLCILSGIGIYLGRDLRFNSWDVLIKPKELIHVSLMRMSDPMSDIYTWVAATIISLLLYGVYLVWPAKWGRFK